MTDKITITFLAENEERTIETTEQVVRMSKTLNDMIDYAGEDGLDSISIEQNVSYQEMKWVTDWCEHKLAEDTEEGTDLEWMKEPDLLKLVGLVNSINYLNAPHEMLVAVLKIVADKYIVGKTPEEVVSTFGIRKYTEEEWEEGRQRLIKAEKEEDERYEKFESEWLEKIKANYKTTNEKEVEA